MGKFEKEAKVLLDAIGGKENVSAATHCATRMRFVLIDEKKADVKAIEEIGAVKIKHNTKSGRSVKRPVVDYSRIEFNLEVA